MHPIDFDTISRLLETARGEGRTNLFEHECYRLLSAMGAEAAPTSRLVPTSRRPTPADLEGLPGAKVVLKVVSPDITHKTEARGIRIVANELGAVEAAFDVILRDVPETYAAYLESRSGHRPDALSGLSGEGLRRRVSERILGVLLCTFVETDASGFATELFVGIRSTTEFGPIISAGLGGVEMEILAEESRKGAAVAIAPTGIVDGARFLELFKSTLSYRRLSGGMRGSRRLVEDAALAECFQSFIDLANHFSTSNRDATLHLGDMEVNPFVISGGKIAPVDGVCSFRPATPAREPRPIGKIAHLLRPRSAAVIGVSERGMSMGRIILNNLFAAGFDRSKTWVVRPNCEAIDGARCVPSISALPEKVDLFVVAVGAPQVPAVVNDLVDHDRANAVILIPGGLGEKEGSQETERALRRHIGEAHRSGDGGPVFLGGNSLGVVSHPGRYDTLFIPSSKLPKSVGDHPRRTCFLSQSGAFIISNLSRMPWLDPAFALSIGNQIDLTAADFLSFLKDEPEIDVIAAYMEGFQPGDGLAFAAAVREAVARGKDVVFYKAGRTTEGRSATAGHTASVAGDYAVCEAALTQAGALVASDFNEFSDFLLLTVKLRGKTLAGNGLMAVSNAGFESVGMADSIRQDHARLRLVRLGVETERRLRDTLVEHKLDGLVDVKNPFDVTPMATDVAYATLVAQLLEDPAIDALVAGVVPLTPAMQTLPAGAVPNESIESRDSIATLLATVAAAQPKPVVAVVDSGDLFDPLAARLAAGGLPVFRSADRAVRALCRFLDVKLRILRTR